MASGDGSRSTVVDSHGLSARSAVTNLRLYPIRVVWGVGGHRLTLSGEFCDETSIFGPAQALTMALAFRMAATAWHLMLHNYAQARWKERSIIILVQCLLYKND